MWHSIRKKHIILISPFAASNFYIHYLTKEQNVKGLKWNIWKDRDYLETWDKSWGFKFQLFLVVVCRDGLGFEASKGQSIKKKKIQIDIHIVLKNYKYLKSLFLNTLRCNHLPTNTNKNKIMSFFHTRLSRIFFFFLVRAFTLMMLKILAFSSSKSYFIYFIISLYNTPNIKCSIFFS